ncbi:CWF19-like protein 2 homolog [Drosophila navojoa]|uniref:CWF19-like protein 2 homolog n=1 Tax=Drosophila navojoa TaxID=7232 RepID=UPI0011BDA236|nr:CWF19-like protein 2 homolog [Drosophila navojoa]
MERDESRTAPGQQAKESQAEKQKNDVSGDTNWVVPTAKPKMSRRAKSATSKSKKLKKKTKKSKHSKKSLKKKHKKKRKYSSSSDSDSDSDSSSSTSSSESDSTREKAKRSRKSADKGVATAPLPIVPKPLLQRDSWMTDSTDLKLNTFSKERREAIKPNAKLQQIDAYNPAENINELNPYWKNNGTGLPAFKKPAEDDDERPTQSTASKYVGSSNWKKPTRNLDDGLVNPNGHESRDRSLECTDNEMQQRTNVPIPLTDAQFNALAARVVKAEIKGDVKLVADLKKQLEMARKARAEHLASGKNHSESTRTEQKSEHILLTRADASGNVRPLLQAKADRKLVDKMQKMAETTSDGNRYDIKQMFEREKYATSAESNLQYANILSKNEKLNDDLDGIFEDRVRKDMAEGNNEQRELNRAVKEQQKMSATLDNCERCFDSQKLAKERLLSVGTKVYLTLPSHVGLQPDHCILTSVQHVSACTLLDEDVWEELTTFRKALTQMFAAQNRDVIFFEIANKLYRRQHLSVHCIPIPQSKGEIAPFYFKKAIEESEQEWSINKQLISLGKKSLRAAIPKGLPYFWVHFGMDRGFAHVIEDQERFPPNYAQQIIAGMLDLEMRHWRNPPKGHNIHINVKSFTDAWKNYDFTKS